MKELTQEQIEFLNKFTKKGKWELNEKTGLVNIYGDFECIKNQTTGLFDYIP